jgi:hypothetical protein
MTIRKRNKAQATPLHRRSRTSARGAMSVLQLVPKNVVSAAGQSVSSIKPGLLRYIDLHPAMAVLTAVAIVALVCVIYLSQVTAVTTANYTLQALQDEHTQLIRKQDELRIQIGRAQALSNIQERATKQLNMVPIGDNFTYLPLQAGPLSALPPAATPGLPTPTAGDVLGSAGP